MSRITKDESGRDVASDSQIELIAKPRGWADPTPLNEKERKKKKTEQQNRKVIHFVDHPRTARGGEAGSNALRRGQIVGKGPLKEHLSMKKLSKEGEKVQINLKS